MEGKIDMAARRQVTNKLRSLDKLAAASGETEGRIGHYVKVGLLHRQADGDFEADSVHRLRLIQFAHSRGVSNQQLEAATARQGDLLALYGELTPGAEAPADLARAAHDLGLDDVVVEELAEILGWDDLGSGTHADMTTLRTVAEAVELGMPRDALMQLMRVLADATDRLADAVLRTFHDYVHERFRAQGVVGRQLLEATQHVAGPALKLVEPALVSFHRRAYQRASREDLLRHLAEDTTAPSKTLGEERATVLFVDLASFTALTATMGDHAAADVLRRFGAAVRSSATRHGGRILKQIGDAFMLLFSEPADAIEFGLAVDRFADAESQFPALHIGAHHGTVLYREGDYVGGTVNLAARVASSGRAGQFLITEDLRDLAADRVDADFTLSPPRRLKGIHDPIRLVEVRRRSLERANRETDPVCGLLLDPDDVASWITWRERTFAFCCDMCRHAFVEDPGRFVTVHEN
ncbi:adenylate/guanylate cyclase domain-containing protein [Mycobacterium gastri]|uniref:adenylate/guanylate cyclase domain-containing protein n=1 Tax=Mycobacterium gastri TaxID=1777 RepID=UPI0003E5A39E|nr:adenylate/guanylate cyclase domain-containing protein [Mycobacterium gastri]ETW26475.1 adenylate cyclase [Mycobacterium gastri 'Wayne']